MSLSETQPGHWSGWRKGPTCDPSKVLMTGDGPHSLESNQALFWFKIRTRVVSRTPLRGQIEDPM